MIQGLQSAMDLSSYRLIRLKNMNVDAAVGAHDHEKNRLQLMIFNIDVYVPLDKTSPKSDALAEVFDYDVLRTIVFDVLKQGHIQLLETIIDQVMARVLALPLVVAARVEAQKPTIFEDCESVGIEIFKIKSILS
jgi:7,8-dihydroneopterin aldolase/epimerase/oxygenase